MHELTTWAEHNLATLIDRACELIRAEIRAYRDADLVTPHELSSAVTRNILVCLHALTHPAEPLNPEAAREVGGERARQGMPLPEVLRAYRLSFSVLWDALIERARSTDGPTVREVLLDVTGRTLRLLDEHALALTEGYRAATTQLLLTNERRRSALIESLLTGQPAAEAGLWEAAQMLGMPPDGELVVVASDLVGLSDDFLPDLERLLAAQGIVSGWRLTPRQHLGVVVLGAPGSSCTTQQIDQLIDVLRRCARGRTGVSPVFHKIGDTPRALYLAQMARARVPAGCARVEMFSSSGLAALVAFDVGEGERLAERVLGPVLSLPAEDREKLLQTFEAYVEHGSVSSAATALFFHRNTVRYRLRRLEALTQRLVSNPRDVAELTAAVYAVRFTTVNT